jgi:BlaI family penicillinase repressor
MATPRLGRVQMRIMRILWERGRLSAREITETLSATAPIAHSTVQTLLRKLEQKGAVGHDEVDRAFVFYPLVEPEPVRRSATRELIDRVFDGSPAGLVSYLLKNEKLTADELGRIRDLIEREDKGAPS